MTTALGGGWSPVVRETAVFVGWLYIVSEVDLLPLAGLDGAILWGWGWRSSPAWLRPGLGVLAGGLVALLVAIQVPTGYVHEVLVELSKPSVLIVAAVCVLCGIAVGPRLRLSDPSSTASQLEGSAR